ncbi:MAG: AEC family transporter [Lachnospiraceae bacterium]
MDNLLFCLNATVPIFLLMVLGYMFMKLHIFDEHFTKKMNSFVFKIALPVLVFQDLSQEDFFAVWDGSYIMFCFIASLLSIGIAIGLSFCFKDKSIQGEFAQSSYRSSAALLGIGFIQNIYGTSGMSPLMIIGTVPLYNVMAVILLSFLKPERERINKNLIKKTLKGIVTNPIIIGIATGMLWSLLRIPQPVIMVKTVKYISNLATPLGLMALGASFEPKKAANTLKPAILASVLKLVVFAALFLPIAVHIGYTTDKLVAVLVMLASPTTVSSFVMAKSMGHEGTVSSNTVMITTFFSAFTLTLWLYILRCLGLV